MEFWDWMDKKVDKAFDRIEKRMDDTFNKIERVFDKDYIDIRTDEEIEESKARKKARLKNILLSSKTEKEKREDKKDFEEFASDIDYKFGEAVRTIYSVEESIKNGLNGINPINIIRNELSSEAKNLKIGDHLYVQRKGYTHHGIYVGDNNVIHYLRASIKLDSLEVFKEGGSLNKMIEDESPSCYSKEKILSRAYSRYNEDSYNLIINNCEHFCRWCRFGD